MSTKIPVLSPSTMKVIDELEETPISEVESIFSQAKAAQAQWSGFDITGRLRYFKALRSHLAANLDHYAQVIAKDNGKVRIEALTADLLPTLDTLLHIEKHARKILAPRRVPTPLMLLGKTSHVEYMARGVVVVISPWNYPFQLAMIPTLSALAGGNAVVIKPSEVTPLVGQLIEEAFAAAGFPEHLVQVAHGAGRLGAALVAAKPDYIFFTGSVETGRVIQTEAAKDLIPTTLELGGKDAMLVFADANLDRAIQAGMWGAFTNSGQVCMSIERLYVQEQVYQEFVSGLVTETKKLTQGTTDDHDIGAITFPKQLTIIKEHVEDALSKGARLETGLPPQEWNTKKGMFLPPMVLTNISPDMLIATEETFGPVLPVIPFQDEQQAIELANSSTYGLNASVWSRDLTKAKRVASQLETGGVVINDVVITVANPYLPFGGVKHSGLGRYHGEVGLRTFCHEKAVMIDKGKNQTELQWYPYKGKYQRFKELVLQLYGPGTNWPRLLKNYLQLKRNKS